MSSSCVIALREAISSSIKVWCPVFYAQDFGLQALRLGALFLLDAPVQDGGSLFCKLWNIRKIYSVGKVSCSLVDDKGKLKDGRSFYGVNNSVLHGHKVPLLRSFHCPMQHPCSFFIYQGPPPSLKVGPAFAEITIQPSWIELADTMGLNVEFPNHPWKKYTTSLAVEKLFLTTLPPSYVSKEDICRNLSNDGSLFQSLSTMTKAFMAFRKKDMNLPFLIHKCPNGVPQAYPMGQDPYKAFAS
ncbi:hypothetical protein VNO77_41791 [Canavalia gladiata]|uniref:Uncharacterized protein n=1 Tax=Canavalia gladiata TaxID=3824 RepID=A0AAN9K1L6_CANGL